jgi:hypothetical protein
MIIIIFASNSLFDKVQSNAQLKIKNVVIIIVKMCIICEKKYHTTNEHREQFNLKRDHDQFNEKKTIETTSASEKTTTKDSIRMSMTKKESTRFMSQAAIQKQSCDRVT